jgi:hypothetical protein
MDSEKSDDEERKKKDPYDDEYEDEISEFRKNIGKN